MKRLLILLFLPLIAFAAPPYDVTFTFSPPSTGGTVDSYNAYVDDCAVSGPTGSPVGTVTSGQTFTDMITADGTYEFCVRGVNATGEQPDPGIVATVSINQEPLPGPIDTLDIGVTCKSGGVEVNCADAGVNVNVTTN